MSDNLFSDGIEEASSKYIIFENILIIGNALLGFVGMSHLKLLDIPLLSILYLGFIIYMLVFYLRKHLCTQCYYYGKACHCGWGKLASKLYESKVGDQKKGGIFAAITWSTLMVLPLIVMGINLYQNFTRTGLIVFVLFFLTVVANNILHVKDCRECKMRYTCPGSAAKKQ